MEGELFDFNWRIEITGLSFYSNKDNLIKHLKKYLKKDVEYIVLVSYTKHGEEHDGYCSDTGEVTNVTETGYFYCTVDNIKIYNIISREGDHKITFKTVKSGCVGYCTCSTVYTDLIGKVYKVEHSEDDTNFKKYEGGGDFIKYYEDKVGERDRKMDERDTKEKEKKRVIREKYDSLMKIVKEKGGRVYRCSGHGCGDYVYLTDHMCRKLSGRGKFCEKCLPKVRSRYTRFKKK